MRRFRNTLGMLSSSFTQGQAVEPADVEPEEEAPVEGQVDDLIGQYLLQSNPDPERGHDEEPGDVQGAEATEAREFYSAETESTNHPVRHVIDATSMQAIWDYMAGRKRWSEIQELLLDGFLTEDSDRYRLDVVEGSLFTFQEGVWRESGFGVIRTLTMRDFEGRPPPPYGSNIPENSAAGRLSDSTVTPVRKGPRMKWVQSIPSISEKPVKEESSGQVPTEGGQVELAEQPVRKGPRIKTTRGAPPIIEEPPQESSAEEEPSESESEASDTAIVSQQAKQVSDTLEDDFGPVPAIRRLRTWAGPLTIYLGQDERGSIPISAILARPGLSQKN